LIALQVKPGGLWRIGKADGSGIGENEAAQIVPMLVGYPLLTTENRLDIPVPVVYIRNIYFNEGSCS
jgi:hypothetical protein